MKFEDLLQQVGDEHRFQFWLIVLLLVPTSLFNSFYDSIILFTTPDHWCNVPGLDHLPLSQQHTLIRPFNNETNRWHNCKRYNLNYDEIKSIDDFQRLHQNQSLSSIDTIDCQEGWNYDQSIYTETAVTWYNFVCEKDFYVNTIMSFSSLGLVVLTPIISNLSDRIGRRYTVLLTFCLGAISCLSPILFRSLPSYIFCRLLAYGILSVYYQLPFVMTQETVSANYRTRSSCISAICYSLGSCMVPIIAKLSGNWVNFALVQLFLTLPYILCFKWIPESPSWLISTKQFDKAYYELERICKINRKPVPEDLMKNIELVYYQKSEHNQDGFMKLITEPGLRFKTFAITVTLIACIIGYGGISTNTINMEAENQLYNVFFLALADLPALFLGWYMITTRLGRRWTNAGGLLLCGMSLLIPAAIARPSSTLITVCTIFGKFGIASTYMVVYQLAGELYPTTLRSQGIGLSVSVSSLAGILIPQLVYIAKYGEWIPLFIMGVVCILASVIASFLPETLNEYLPQNAKEASEFGEDREYFSLANMDTQTIRKQSMLGSSIKSGKLEVDKKNPSVITLTTTVDLP